MINVQGVLFFITTAGMETCCLYAVLTAANNGPDRQISIPLLLLLYPLSWGIARALRFLKWPKPVLTCLNWLLWPVFLLLMIKVQLFNGTSFTDATWLMAIPQGFARIFYSIEPVLLIFTGSIVLWWTGRRMAYVQPSFKVVITEFQFGMVILLLVFFTGYGLELDQSGYVPTAMIFFFLGLTGLAVSQDQSQGRLRAWKSGYRPGILLGSILLILLSGFLISLIITPELLNQVLNALKWVWGLIEKVLDFLARLIPQSSSPEAPPPGLTIPAPEPGMNEGPGFSWPGWLTSGLKVIWIILVSGLAAAAIWRVSSQIIGWMRHKTAVKHGERERLKGAFRADLAKWLKDLFAWIKRPRFKSGGRMKAQPQAAEVSSVRQLYRQLLHWAGENGYPREETQTPAEYQKELSGVMPGAEEDLALITEEYMNVRYGSLRPSQEDLERLKQKWHNLKRTGFTRTRGNPDQTGDE